MARPEPRILRIGIVHENRILEERLFRKPRGITIGQAPENTFVYPLPAFPRSHELLSYRRGAWALVFPPGLQGKVSTGEDLFDLAELVQTGRAAVAGAMHSFALDEGTRGKIRLGELTLLFQFVTAPAAVPRLRLPAGATSSWARRLDVAYAVTLLVSFALLAGPAAWMHAWYEARGRFLATQGKHSRVFQQLEAEIDVRNQRVPPPRTAALEVPETPLPVEPVERPVAPTSRERPSKPSAGTPGRTASRARAAAKVDPAKKALENVRDVTLLKYLAPGAPGGAGDVLASGLQAERLLEAWSFSRGAEVATTPNQVAQFVGEPRRPAYAPASNIVRRPGPIAVRDVAPPTKTPEIAVRLKIQGDLGEQTGLGSVDKGSVADVFKRRQGALRHCYEKRLAVNQALAGRVRLQFTIGPGGRVTDIALRDNSSGDAELGRCLVERVKEWPFPRPQNGSVTFVHTLVLTSG